MPGGVDFDSVLDAFHLLLPIFLTNFKVQNTNQRAEIISLRDDLPKFIMVWFNVTNSDFYDFLVLLLFVYLVLLTYTQVYFSTKNNDKVFVDKSCQGSNQFM